MFGWCVVFFLRFRQNCPRGKKKLDVHVKVYFFFFFFFASFFISNNYITVSVIHSGGKHTRGSNRIALIELGKNCKRPNGGNIFLLSIYLILFVQSSVYLSEKHLPCLA